MIIFICWISRYFWLFTPTIDEQCPTATTMSCLLDGTNYDSEWFSRNLLAYICLFLVDISSLFLNVVRPIRWVSVLMIVHLHKQINPWVLGEYTDILCDALILVLKELVHVAKIIRSHKVKTLDMTTQTAQLVQPVKIHPNFVERSLVDRCAELYIEERMNKKHKRESERSITPLLTKKDSGVLDKYKDDDGYFLSN